MMKKILLTLLLPLLGCLGLAAGDAFYNVRNYGAAGDGVQIDSPAINAAIEAAAEAGGGTVFFPAGTYLSYSLHLRDHITLHLDRGAVLKAAVPDEEHAYDPAEPNESTFQDFGHSHWQNSLIWGIGLHDVAIVGGGLIDGTGALSNGFGRQDRLANKAIALKECRDVTIRDIRLLQCGHFALLLTGVDNLTIHNVLADTNRDAFDIDCCANVKISDCQVNTLNDDAIVLKCSYALGYPKATENVTITNCQVSGYDPGTVFGGTFTKNITAAPDRDGPTGRIKLGTESNGGFRNITISNCTFDRCRGLAIETVDGAVIEDLVVNNIVMREVCNSPIYVRLGNRARGPQELPHSVIRRVRISNVSVKDADSRYASMIFGLEGHCIEDVTLSHIHIQYRGGLGLEDVTAQKGSNNFFNRDLAPGTRDPFDVPQQEKGYPEPSSHGVLPAAAFYISHARNVSMDHIRFEFMEKDRRPGIVLTDVEGIRLEQVSGNDCAPRFILKDVKDFVTVDVDGVKNTRISAVKQKEIK